MPGRKYQQGTSTYRYSINGQEKENDLNDNITTALYWEYDSRIGRRWNVDPKPNVSLSPFATFGNNPISQIDILGDSLGDPNWFQNFVHWLEKPSLEPWEKGGAMATINENINPIFIANNHASRILYGKDFYGAPNDFRGRGGAIADAGTDVVLFLTAEKFFKVTLGPKNATQALERSVSENKALTGSAKPTPTPDRPTPKQSEINLTPRGFGEINQQPFKNGRFLTTNIKSSVIPESFSLMSGTATEVKNFTYNPLSASFSNSSINNLVSQIIQRRTNLPKGSVQNIIIDVRGQFVPEFSQMKARDQILTQTGSQGVNVMFKTK